MLRIIKEGVQDREMVIWIAALAFLAIHDPTAGTDFTMCPLNHLGIQWCPGCGLGGSVSFILHGDLAASFQSHVLGIPALCILLMRIVTLFRNSIHHRNPSIQH